MKRPKSANGALAWTAAEDRLVLRMRVRGESSEAIAAVIQRTPAAVQSRASKLRRTDAAPVPELRFWSASETDRVIIMRDGGATIAAIAKAIGRSEHAVRDRVRALQDEGTLDGAPGGVPADHVRRIPTTDPLLAALRAEHGRSA